MRNKFLGVQISVVLAVKQSHHCGNQQNLRTLQANVTPVQSFAAATYFIPVMITKGPQLISETSIPLLIPEWWRLCSLVPRPLPDFISQPWRKIGRRPCTITTSRTGNGGLGLYVMWTRFRNDGNVPKQYAANTASNRIVKLA